MVLRRAQTIFMPKSINCVTMIITLEGIERIKNSKKKTTKQSEESRECSQVEWLLFSLIEITPSSEAG